MVSACRALLGFVAGPVLGQQPQKQLLSVCLCEMKPPQAEDGTHQITSAGGDPRKRIFPTP